MHRGVIAPQEDAPVAEFYKGFTYEFTVGDTLRIEGRAIELDPRSTEADRRALARATSVRTFRERNSFATTSRVRKS